MFAGDSIFGFDNMEMTDKRIFQFEKVKRLLLPQKELDSIFLMIFHIHIHHLQVHGEWKYKLFHPCKCLSIRILNCTWVPYFCFKFHFWWIVLNLKIKKKTNLDSLELKEKVLPFGNFKVAFQRPPS
jgi:hypothetical protein